MKLVNYILSSVLFFISYSSSIAQKEQKIDVDKNIRTYFENYSRSQARIDKIKMLNCSVDTASQTVKIELGGGFQEQFFIPQIVDSIYADIRNLLPEEMRDYNMEVITEDHKIEDLIPNFFRKKKEDLDQSRLLQKEYNGAPWVTNISRPYKADKGLEGKHIALWQSHGLYYKVYNEKWTWQRPYIYCTTEDLFSQTFVIPYIIPMLQNAGAIVFTPRERDWQSNEVVVDNDTHTRSGMYMESYSKKASKARWTTAKSLGFAHYKELYEVCDTPFLDGTSRYIASTTADKADAFAQWVPNIPEAGKYAVYISYHSYSNSTTDAHYKVHHKGGITEFKVNQKMGGGTWVYLGTFEFDAGINDKAMVTLSNQSSTKSIISADAVRFGGGMGNVVPVSEESNVPISGFPRWAEAAKYSTFWYGMPYQIHTGGFVWDDYKNDINCRSKAINYLCGGSMFNPNKDGLKVPLEATIAFHTDAGFFRNDSVVGSLSIYRTNFNNGLTGAGLNRYVSRDLASMLLTNLTIDLKKYKWNVRQLWNRNYGEAREPMTPTCILEMLSHQNFTDMKLGYDPKFKFDFCRSVYKTIVKFIATEHKKAYVIQPLPVHGFYINLNEHKETAELNWSATKDSLEPTAVPQQYIVYTRIGNGAFDNGTLVKDNKLSVKMQPNVTYSFKVTAVNQGGESFPSETLAAGISTNSTGMVLVVNGFTRLEGPKIIDNEKECGFDLDADPGVQYGAFAGFCGKQLSFDKKKAGIESHSGLGYSGNELEGTVVMGNTFDYTYTHGQAIMSSHKYSFTSTSEEAVMNGRYDMKKFKIVDMIYGVQKDFSKKTANMLNEYSKKGGRLIISGANISPLLNQLNGLKAKATGALADKNLSTISGSNTNFKIYRQINSKNYSVPAPTQLKAENGAFAMLQYEDGSIAGVAHNGAKNKTKDQHASKSIVLGFPLESITETTLMNQLMRGIIAFLEK